MHRRWVPAHNGGGGVQSRDSPLLTRPGQALQPGDVVLVVRVEGVEVDAGAPGDLRNVGGQRDGSSVWQVRDGACASSPVTW